MADAAAPPAAVEAQDPLPEADWFWRRSFVFVLTTVLCIGIAMFANEIAEAPSADQTKAFLSLAKWSLLLLWFIATYYLVAPSAEQVTRMWQTASVLKSGVTLSRQSIATAPDGSAASNTSIAGVGGDTGIIPDGPLRASVSSGLPETPGTYAGPDLGDAPETDPNLPENAPWAR